MVYTVTMKNAVTLNGLLLAVILLGAGCKSQPPAGAAPGNLKDIYAGVADVFLLLEDNTLWGAGYNRSGQLGLGADRTGGEARGEPVVAQINDSSGVPFTGVLAVAAGENHTVILKDDGTLWGAGDSSNGELGMAEGALPVFTRLEASGAPLSGVTSLAAGNNSTFYTDSAGGLWAAGYNYYGELGLGTRDKTPSFTKAESAGQNVKALASGLRHTALLKGDGTLWAAGYNFNGQLGLGDTDDRAAFTEVTGAGTGIAAVAAGNYHTVILKEDGSVWTAGSNYWGQLGFQGKGDVSSFTRVPDEGGNPLSGVKEIAARGNITVLVKADGSLLFAGDYSGAEGGKEPDPEAFFVDGDAPSARLDTLKPGFVPLVPEDGTAARFDGVKKIVLGYNSIYVVSANGLLWAAGSNRYGQLSLGLDTEILPVLKLIER